MKFSVLLRARQLGMLAGIAACALAFALVAISAAAPARADGAGPKSFNAAAPFQSVSPFPHTSVPRVAGKTAALPDLLATTGSAGVKLGLVALGLFAIGGALLISARRSRR